ncbi:MAG: hypothetical protein IJN52_04955 [Bacteroidales bacterium]|nr:hypothetical protein [Bacteroidales bacterium]
MGKIRATMAAMLTILAFTAYQSDADAQARREANRTTGTSRATSVTRTTPSGTRSSGKSVTRSTVSQDRKVGVTKPSSQTTRPSSQTARPATQTRPSAATRPSNNAAAPKIDKNERKPSTTVRRPAVTRPSASSKPAAKPSGGTVNKPINVTRPGNRTDRPANKPDDKRPSVRPDAGRGNANVRPDRDRPERPAHIRPDHRPDVHRVHPRDRAFVDYHHPSHFWAGHNHCFGHRVRILPSHARRHIHFGVTYYCYDDIWYRPYGGYYVVCRPPFGTVLAANLIADMAWTAVRMSYYYTVANTYSKINENNEYIAEQNAIIAQNNATIAAQNQTIAMNQQLASQAYTLANELGLVQSFAAAGSDYYYQDGVFYVMDANGEYKVIVPPAGAMVEILPEDYDMITLNDNEYYKVDDTVYKVTISEGKPYFEVLGQLYS